MDELNKDFDPLNEYAQIEQNSEEITPEPQQKVEFDTVDNDDVFTAFDKASNTDNTVQDVQHFESYNNTEAHYTQPQYQQNQYDQPKYTQPQPSAFTNVDQQYNIAQNTNQPQPVSPAPYPTHPVAQQPQPMPYTYGQTTQPMANTVQPPMQQPIQQPVVPPHAPYPMQNTQPPQAYGTNYTEYTPQPPVNGANANYPAYAQNPAYNPYEANLRQPQPTVQKSKVPTSTKVLIGVLIGFLALFMVGFFVSCSMMIIPEDAKKDSDNPLSGYATEPNFDDFFSDDFSDDFSNSPYFDFSPSYDGETFKEDIVLQADEGQTQEKNEDKDDNTYAPDKDAKGIEFEKIPKDKDNKKYTPQSAYNTVADSVVSVVCFEDKITDNEEDIVGEGTGIIISADGYIITNSHVIGDTKAYKINIILNDSTEYTAKIVGYDTRTDLAVLKIKAKNLTYAKFSDSSLVEVGQDVVAIGNPGGTSFQNSLTKGIVSAVDRELELSANVKYIQIDAAINPGNSGGALCNLYGQVIGINTAKISSEEYEGMGFAIPSNKAAEIANDLIHYGYVKGRVRIGLMGREVDEQMKSQYGVPNGVLITEISEDGPLADTKIKEFDIITEIDGKEVSSFQEIFSILEEHKPGDKVKLTLYRLEE